MSAPNLPLCSPYAIKPYQMTTLNNDKDPLFIFRMISGTKFELIYSVLSPRMTENGYAI